MQTKTVKTYIKQLIRKFKTKTKVAQELGVSLRYVLMLEKGEKVPSDHLRKLIKMVLK
jgi:DNA-binding transcriptional regulator YiaG